MRHYINAIKCAGLHRQTDLMSWLKRCYNGCELISSLHDWISLFQIKFPSLADSATWSISSASKAKQLESIFSPGRGRKCCLNILLIFLIHEGNREYCPVFRTSTIKVFTALIFSGEEKTVPHVKFAYFLTPMSSHILFRYILHMPAFLYEWSLGNTVHSQISIPDISFLC